MVETKLLAFSEFKLADSDTGTFEGYASRFGTIDSYGDTIDKGAYAETIPEFLERGFLGWGHDWTNPVGFFTSAEEKRDGLYVKGQFHSDAQAQVYRQRVKERSEAGKFMGMSIGFTPMDYEFREQDGQQIRALKRINLHEVSLVTVPAEHNSQVTGVKVANTTVVDALASIPRESMAETFRTFPLKDASEAELRALLEAIEESQLTQLLAQGAVVIEEQADEQKEPDLDPVTKRLVSRHLEMARRYAAA